MEILKPENNTAEIVSDNVVISDLSDALDLIGNCSFNGMQNIIIKREHLTPDFFDLKTGVAGDILQKFSTYDCRLAIIGNFQNTESKSLRDFIHESNKTGRINFVETRDAALRCFASK